jgi:hypothetical protein
VEGKGSSTYKNSPGKYEPQILDLLQAVQEPTEVTVIDCRGHQRNHSEVTQGKNVTDKAAKTAALSLTRLESKVIAFFSSNLGPSTKPVYST